MSEKQEQVHLVIYSPKHGVDHSITRTERQATLCAFTLAYQSVVEEDRYDGTQPKLVQTFKDCFAPEVSEHDVDIAKCETALSDWCDVEMDSYGTEFINIEQHPLI